METQLIQTNKSDASKHIVNKKIRICVNCGSKSLNIKNHRMLCKECGAFFQVKETKN